MPNPRYATKAALPSWPEVTLRDGGTGIVYAVQVALHVREDKRRALPYEVHADLNHGDLLELSVWIGDSAATGIELTAFRCGLRRNHCEEDLDALFSNMSGSACDKLKRSGALSFRGHIGFRNAAGDACERMVAMAERLFDGKEG